MSPHFWHLRFLRFWLMVCGGCVMCPMGAQVGASPATMVPSMLMLGVQSLVRVRRWSLAWLRVWLFVVRLLRL